MRPVLVGTRSVGDSEAVAAALDRRGIAYRILNARQDAEEAAIVAAAGELGGVTVATNMAGRGTDIELSKDAHAAGGQDVILTSFHEPSRTVLPLAARAGHQAGTCHPHALPAVAEQTSTLLP